MLSKVVDGRALQLILLSSSSLRNLNAGAETSPTLLGGEQRRLNFQGFSSIEMWILRHPERVIPPCLRVRYLLEPMAHQWLTIPGPVPDLAGRRAIAFASPWAKREDIPETKGGPRRVGYRNPMLKNFTATTQTQTRFPCCRSEVSVCPMPSNYHAGFPSEALTEFVQHSLNKP